MSKTPSIAVIPSGYKASKIYSVLPTNGDADLDFTRNCVATRVNQNGLLEEVGLNVPRLDYSDGGCPSLLLEPQRSNLITYSEDFSNSVWTKVGSSEILNNTTSPNGNLSGAKLKEDTTLGTHRVYYNLSFTVDALYTFSIFIKKDTRRFVRISASNLSVFGVSADFDIQNGLVTNTLNGSAKIESYNDGWYRCSVTGLSSTVGGTVISVFSCDVNGITTYQGDGIGGVYIFGGQLEEGSYDTSYIPTNGAEVTRFNDEASKDTFTSLNDSTANDFTLFLEKSQTNDSVTLGSDNAMLLFENSSSNNLLSIERYRNNDLRVYNYIDGVYLLSGQINYSSSWKLAIKRQGLIFSIFIDGNLISTYTEITPLKDIDSVLIRGAQGTLMLKDLRVYNEALTDEEIIELTQ